MPQPARVAILVAAFEAERFIGELLESIAAQTAPAFSVIIVDDASSDSTFDVCAEFARSDGRVRVLRNPRNQGWLETLKRLLAEVGDAEFTAFVSHDDLLAPEFVASHLVALDSRPDAVASFSPVRAVRRDGSVDVVAGPKLSPDLTATERARELLRKGARAWVPYHGLVRSEVTRGGTRPRAHRRGAFRADVVWALDVVLRGPVVKVDEPLYVKRTMAGSVSDAWKRGGVRDGLAVSGAQIRTVRRSHLSVREKTVVMGLVARSFLATLKSERERARARRARESAREQRRR